LFVSIATKGKTTQVAQLDLYDVFWLGVKAKPLVFVIFWQFLGDSWEFLDGFFYE